MTRARFWQCVAHVILTLTLGEANGQTSTTAALEEVVVTGSHIRRNEAQSVAPIQVISAAEIQRTGKLTLGEFLQTVTADGPGSIPKTFGNGFAAGGSGISLRGLGPHSTLVLLNGRRIAPFALADDAQRVFTDLSVIPVEAIERVEVLKDGASAIYGSDAVAGVVNVIMRSNFQGVSVKGSYGRSGDSDGGQSLVAVTAGIGDLQADRYNFFVNVEATKEEPVEVGDRKNRKWIGSGDLRPYGFEVYHDGLGGIIYPGGGNAISSLTGSVGNGVLRRFVSLPGCEKFTPVITPPDPEGGCLWDFNRFIEISPEQEVLNVFSRGTFAVSDSMQAFAELGFSKKRYVSKTSPSGVAGTWGYPGGFVNADFGAGAVVLGATHPDNPYGVTSNLRYNAIDVGRRASIAENEFIRAVIGVTGSVGDWTYESAYLHSETTLVNTFPGFLRYSAVRNALANPASPLFPWRIGDDANLTPALRAALSPEMRADGHSVLDLVDARVSRELNELPGGPIALAVGTEYRRLRNGLTPITYTDVGDVIGIGYSAFSGQENVLSGYLEVIAPVLPQLELQGALRTEHFSGGDTATTPKAGLRYSPWDFITLRGTYSEGFRAPQATETGEGGNSSFVAARDPVRCPNGRPVAGATSIDCNIQISLTTLGTAGLKPEESENVSFGIVLKPLPDTLVTIDVFRIVRTDEITPQTGTRAAQSGQVVRGNNLIAGVPGTGTLLAAFGSYENANSTTVKGADLAVRHRLPLGNFGSLTLDAQLSRIASFVRVFEDGSREQYAGTHGNCDVSNCMGTPKTRANLGATWETQDWSLSGVINFRDAFENVFVGGDTCASNFADGSDAPKDCEIGSFWSLDLTSSYRPTTGLEVFGSVQNVFDRIAPLDPTTTGTVNYQPQDYSGAIGRFFTVGLKYSFE